ncbi:MAG: hypothetical protein E6G30_08785 [Actinobacteria bacterium]|nr:MAG: hypothetical protein E6G30_08785 [Actinomycetota bacterium]
MADLDGLPPDQRAALLLLLRQRQSYQQLSETLHIEEDAVRRRAHAALEALGPPAGQRLTDERRTEIADYLLGQQTAAEREATRAHLAESTAARDWAQGVADRLHEVAPDAVPDIPDGAAAAEAAPPEEPPPPPPLAEEPAPALREEGRPRGRGGIPTPPRPSSRLGGALLLAGAAIVVAVVLVIVLSGGGGGGKKSARATTPTNTTTTQGANRPVAQINLFSPRGGTKTVALAQIFRNGSQRAIVIAAQGLSPGTYALWLYNSASSAKLLGFVPARVTSSGKFATQGALPADAGNYQRIVVTSERITPQTKRVPSRPGTVVLQGTLKLG